MEGLPRETSETAKTSEACASKEMVDHLLKNYAEASQQSLLDIITKKMNVSEEEARSFFTSLVDEGKYAELPDGRYRKVI